MTKILILLLAKMNFQVDVIKNLITFSIKYGVAFIRSGLSIWIDLIFFIILLLFHIINMEIINSVDFNNAILLIATKNTLFISKKIEYFNVFKRGMLTRLGDLATKKICTNTFSNVSKYALTKDTKLFSRGYAKRTVNDPESPNNVTDPLGLKNNPVTAYGRHYETHREECQENPNCVDYDCQQLCGTPGSLKATGHFTSSKNPAVATGNKCQYVSKTNLSGKPKDQYRVDYKKAHNTSKTKEHVNGTKKLNSEPNLKKNVMDHEDKS